jgi:hypothetical protein
MICDACFIGYQSPVLKLNMAHNVAAEYVASLGIFPDGTGTDEALGAVQNADSLPVLFLSMPFSRKSIKDLFGKGSKTPVGEPGNRRD